MKDPYSYRARLWRPGRGLRDAGRAIGFSAPMVKPNAETSTHMNRRDWLQLTFAGLATTALSRSAFAALRATRITVYKSPTCGCCGAWVEHMKQNGFTVDAQDVADDMLEQVKTTAGVPKALRSCHVALAGGYAFEGHVPGDQVKKVLAAKPKLAGLAVPGMPAGSPGMEMGGRKDPYDGRAFDRAGKTWVYKGGTS
jgi:hypothetical protein